MLKKIIKMLKQNEKGFSMLELLLYIAIVGVIVAFAVPKYVNTMALANTAKIQSDLQTLDAAITMYQLQNGKAPESIETDLDDYIAHVDKLKPPTGKFMLKGNDTPVDITADNYTLVSNGEEAAFQSHTVDEFGK